MLELERFAIVLLDICLLVRLCQYKSFTPTTLLDHSQKCLIDLACRIREDEHPEYGGLEAENAGIELA